MPEERVSDRLAIHARKRSIGPRFEGDWEAEGLEVPLGFKLGLVLGAEAGAEAVLIGEDEGRSVGLVHPVSFC